MIQGRHKNKKAIVCFLSLLLFACAFTAIFSANGKSKDLNSSASISNSPVADKYSDDIQKEPKQRKPIARIEFEAMLNEILFVIYLSIYTCILVTLFLTVFLYFTGIPPSIASKDNSATGLKVVRYPPVILGALLLLGGINYFKDREGQIYVTYDFSDPMTMQHILLGSLWMLLGLFLIVFFSTRLWIWLVQKYLKFKTLITRTAARFILSYISATYLSGFFFTIFFLIHPVHSSHNETTLQWATIFVMIFMMSGFFIISPISVPEFFIKENCFDLATGSLIDNWHVWIPTIVLLVSFIIFFFMARKWVDRMYEEKKAEPKTGTVEGSGVENDGKIVQAVPEGFDEVAKPLPITGKCEEGMPIEDKPVELYEYPMWDTGNRESLTDERRINREKEAKGNRYHSKLEEAVRSGNMSPILKIMLLAESMCQQSKKQGSEIVGPVNKKEQEVMDDLKEARRRSGELWYPRPGTKEGDEWMPGNDPADKAGTDDYFDEFGYYPEEAPTGEDLTEEERLKKEQEQAGNYKAASTWEKAIMERKMSPILKIMCQATLENSKKRRSEATTHSVKNLGKGMRLFQDEKIWTTDKCSLYFLVLSNQQMEKMSLTDLLLQTVQRLASEATTEEVNEAEDVIQDSKLNEEVWHLEGIPVTDPDFPELLMDLMTPENSCLRGWIEEYQLALKEMTPQEIDQALQVPDQAMLRSLTLPQFLRMMLK